MTYINKTLKDGAGADFVAAVWTPGRDSATNSSPVALDSESKARLDSLDNKLPALKNSLLPVAAQNITTKFREAFEMYPSARWTETLGSGDLIFIDGNAAAASYLTISKSPLNSGTESSVESSLTFDLPIELAFGASLSQRTLGQEFSVELVDTGTPLAEVTDLAISSITQATTVLTVDTTLAHNLSVGKSIGIRDCSNTLVNYPALVVASVPSPTQFTATAGPGGTIVSQTVVNPTGNKGFVFFRERLGRAQNGISQIFENATATQASLYLRSESGDAFPSGTIAGVHSASVGTTASVQLVNSAYQYTFSPTTEYRILAQADRVQWSDSAVDALGQTSSRLLRTQVCVDPDPTYKLRVRANNSKSLTVPVAQIISAVKTGTTTATITTDVANNLAVGDLVVVYGIRDQAATSFPNLVVATAVASIVNATTFTIVIGTAGTATSYGGFVSKVQGGNLGSALGYNAIVAQSAVLSTLSDNTRQLVITGSGTWAGLSIGDMVNVLGLRDATAGATLGVDGVWKVANVATTALTLVLPFTGQRTVPADFGSVNCGGGIIKRTCLRLSFVRIFDYERERVELLARPSGDLAGSVPVVLQGGTTAVTGTLTAVTTAGTPAAPTNYFLNSAATTNGALIITGTAGIVAGAITNIGASTAYVRLYNKATAPTVGTDVAEIVIPVVAGGYIEMAPGFNGHRFPLGLGIAITGAAADLDTTAVAAGQVKVKLSRVA